MKYPHLLVDGAYINDSKNNLPIILTIVPDQVKEKIKKYAYIYIGKCFITDQHLKSYMLHPVPPAHYHI